MNIKTVEVYIWAINQVWGQDGWILAKLFFLCLFTETGSRIMIRNRVEDQAWSMKDLLYGFRGHFLTRQGGWSRAVQIAPSCPLG